MLQELDVANTPVFEPSVMPPSVMGYPVPAVPMWTQATDGGHYPMSVPAGYVFPNPVGCESMVSFVPTYSNGHPPVYAMPGVGHPMSAHFHGAENMMPQMMPIHGVPAVQPHLTHADVGHHIPVTITQAGMPIPPPPTPQVVYISPPPVEEHLEPTDLTVGPKATSPSFDTSSHVVTPIDVKAPESSPPRPPPVTGPGLATNKSNSASFEFAGPVVYDPQSAKSDRLAEPNNNEFSLEEKTNDIKLDVVIDIGDVNSSNVCGPVNEATEVHCNVETPVEKSVDVPPSIEVNGADASSNHLASPPVVVESDHPLESDKPATSLPSSPQPPTQPAVKSWSSLFAGKVTENKKTGIIVHPTNNTSEVSASSDADFPAIGGSQVDASTYREWKPQKPVRVPLEKVTTVGVHSDPLAYRLQGK